MKINKEDYEKALEYLHEYLKPGDTVYTILRHVSRSGMSRSVSALAITKDGRHGDNMPYDISHLVAKVCGYTLDRTNGGVKVGGCGFDAGHEVVYHLGYKLFGKGFSCLGENCPSNDHVNGDRDYTPHTHTDGGYALVRRWL